MVILNIICLLIILFCLYKIYQIFVESNTLREMKDAFASKYIRLHTTLIKDLTFPDMTNENLDFFAIIDTKTNYYGNAISIGVVVVNSHFEIQQAQYYLIPEELIHDHNHKDDFDIIHVYKTYFGRLFDCENHIRTLMNQYNITNIYAYNAFYVKKSLPEMNNYNWFDIAKVATYKQYNHELPLDADYDENGQLLRYAMKNVIELMMKTYYKCVNHALYNALDELKIMKLIGLPIEKYSHTKI